jgi:ribonuclease P/MRP protein subunit RPP1
MITDACIFANQDGTATPRRMVLTAKSCGITRVVVCGDTCDIPESYAGVIILRGKVIDGQYLDVIRKNPTGSVVMINAGENSFNRAVVSTRGVHLLTGIADLPKGGFDHTVAKMAADHNTGVVLNISRIINQKSRKTAISRYAEILLLQRKYHFQLMIASGTDTIFGFRNPTEIIALCSLFGMTRSEVYAALNGLDAILTPPLLVTVVKERET